MDVEDLKRGTELLVKHLDNMIDEDPEISDFSAAFESYAMGKFSLGNYGTTVRVGGKRDLGIDFYSKLDRKYHIGQCKIPARDYLEAHPEKIKDFGPGSKVIDDVSTALRYLLGDSKLPANDRVKQLYGLIEADRNHQDFVLVCFLIVYGKLDSRASESFQELKAQWKTQKNVSIILQDIEDLATEFMVGAARSTGDVDLGFAIPDKNIMRSKDYCYFLASASDLYTGFQKYGWRLFDLNLRYEIRNSTVNGDIIRSLSRQKSRRQFHHFNNGVIILAKNYRIQNDQSRVHISGAQIVNGLQTVKSIYNAVTMKEVTFDQLSTDCLVQVKVIRVDDQMNVGSQIVYATNNQNPMAPRNLRANDVEQKTLRSDFAMLTPRWFLQVKQGEWESLTQEQGRFFKDVVGFSPAEFRPDAARQRGRVIDNQDAAKAWLAFIGFADLAGDRVEHYFSDKDIYDMAFTMSPSTDYWTKFAQAVDFREDRKDELVSVKGKAIQYLLAYFLWQFIKNFIPSPQQYREEALNEGVNAGKIKKSSGSFTSTDAEQDTYLATNSTYQTWRLMANMKELLVECARHMLAQKYGPLCPETCYGLFRFPEPLGFAATAEIRDRARSAATAPDLGPDEVFGRILRLLKYAAAQFYEDKRERLSSTSRLRTVLLNRDIAAEFKKQLASIGPRKAIDRPWKPAGKTFLESLPPLPK